MATVKRRVGLATGSPLAIVNANAAIAFDAMKAGSRGFCGVFTNFHPDLYQWLLTSSEADPALADRVFPVVAAAGPAVHRGTVWTTDAPFRETEEAIAAAHAAGALAVEMEAAALYAFARAQGRAVLCFAHVTNRMAQVKGDFEKGEAAGSRDAQAVVAAAARAWCTTRKFWRAV